MVLPGCRHGSDASFQASIKCLAWHDPVLNEECNGWAGAIAAAAAVIKLAAYSNKQQERRA
jgi:hypothetical protein